MLLKMSKIISIAKMFFGGLLGNLIGLNMKKKSNYQIAQKYAEALFHTLESENALKTIFDDMQKISQALKPEQISLLQDPSFGSQILDETLDEIRLKFSLDQRTLSFLKAMISAHQLNLIFLVIDAFKHIYYQAHHIVEVSVQSAWPLSTAQTLKLEEGLKKALGQEIIASYQLDPTLLGGLSVQYGNILLDDTLKEKLNRLEQAMKGYE